VARKQAADKAKAKAAREKKLAIGGAVLLVLVLAYEGPKTLKMLHPKPAVHLTSATDPGAAAPVAAAATPGAAPTSLAAPTLAGAAPAATPTSTTPSLVASVPVSADPGQLQTFARFATKDPFAAQASATASGAGGAPATPSAPKSGGAPTPPSSGSGSGSTPKAPPTPPTPPPTTAVISLNGQLMSVTVGGAFPTTGTVFDRAGSLFLLKSLTQKTAKIAISGGSLASGDATLTLSVGTPVTLQNTADGSKYTLLLEPQGTAVPTSTTPGATTPAAATSTTPAAPVVPSSGG
jgi:hypothetical protein